MMKQSVSIGEDVFIAPNATVIGRVSLGDKASVWFGAIIRGDSDEILIGNSTNVQDNAVIHVDPGDPVKIGDSCIIGHGAIVHGAELQDHVLIGMNAVVLNNVKIGSYCIIGAAALVTAGTDIPPGSLVLGSPARIIRQLSPEERRKIDRNAEVYVHKAAEYMDFYSGK